MNVLFLTLVEFDTLRDRNLYTDLLRAFVKNGHEVFVISPVEKRKQEETHLIREDHAAILRLRIGNIQKTGKIEKGINTILLEPTIRMAIKRYFYDVKYDLVLYSTPPITLVSAVDYVKRRDHARTYLLLKDIFPQNAVDIGMMRTTGAMGLLYRHFRNREKKLYRVSDRIGCMSTANVEYLLRHNPEVDPAVVEVCPNSVEIVDLSVDRKERDRIRIKYGIPLDRKVFVYGGNLGKPQGIPFLIECLRKCADVEDAFFLVVGAGTEYGALEAYAGSGRQRNLKLMQRLPKEDYDTMVGACDVGMIFLDHRFTIPNFPSRLLSYMQARLPVLAATDPNTDLGTVITDGGFGWWCESNDVEAFRALVGRIISSELADMGNAGMKYLAEHYSADKAYEIIARD